MIEASAAGARRRDHQTIECDSSAFVRVEAITYKLSQEPSALGITVSNDARHSAARLAQG